MESAKDQARDAAKTIREKQRDNKAISSSSSTPGIASAASDAAQSPSGGFSFPFYGILTIIFRLGKQTRDIECIF